MRINEDISIVDDVNAAARQRLGLSNTQGGDQTLAEESVSRQQLLQRLYGHVHLSGRAEVVTTL